MATSSKDKKPETRPRSGMVSAPVTMSLHEEATKIVILAAAESVKAKVQQRKMTEFMETLQGRVGELPSRPRGPSSHCENLKQAQKEPMVMSETVQTAKEKVAEALHHMQQEACTAQVLLQGAGPSRAATTVQSQDDGISVIGESSGGADKDIGWQVWSNRRRRIGADLGNQDQCQRGEAPHSSCQVSLATAPLRTAATTLTMNSTGPQGPEWSLP